MIEYPHLWVDVSASQRCRRCGIYAYPGGFPVTYCFVLRDWLLRKCGPVILDVRA